MQKTSQFKTQCKGDISRALKQQKSPCFIPRYAKLQICPYKTSCCAEHLLYVVITDQPTLTSQLKASQSSVLTWMGFNG